MNHEKGAKSIAQNSTVEDDRLWYKDAIIYEVHVKTFFDTAVDGIGDFKGITLKLDYLRDLGINAIWLLPFYPSPLKDDGYDISDYFDIHPLYGNLRDFKDFLREAHARGIRIITELIINHTSDQHEWFKRARISEEDSEWRNFYVWRKTPDGFKEARIIFKDFESSNWTYDNVAKAYYWHRFYSHQPDLNFDNQATQEAVFDVVDYWLKMGVDGLRLDAVPYLFERDGTNCENLPETHEFLKKLRSHIDSNFPNRMLLAEANQWPTDAASYFGDGDECQMVFHFPLMPRIFMAVQMEDRFPIEDILGQTPAIPESCQWGTFLRNHDELTLEMVTDEERNYMYNAYARDKKSRINLGIRRRLAPLLGNDRRKLELMNVLLFTLPGTPTIYYGDEIGMGDDFYLGDRNGVRTPMQWSADRNAGFSKASPQKLYLPVIIDPRYHYEVVNVENQQNDPSSLLSWMKKMIAMRKNFKALGRGTLEFLHPTNPKVISYVQKYGEEIVLVAANLSGRPQHVNLELINYRDFIPVDVLGGSDFPIISHTNYALTFGPYGYFIFNLVKKTVAPNVLVRQQIKVIGGQKKLIKLFEGKSKYLLETQVLPEYLRANRWFGGKGRSLDKVKISNVIALEHEKRQNQNFILIVETSYKEGLPENYFVPIAFSPNDISKQLSQESIIAMVRDDKNGLGTLYDGVYDEVLRSKLLQMILRKRSFEGEDCKIVGRTLPRISSDISQTNGIFSKVLKADQSNTSIIYGDKLFLKLLRRTEEGINPEIDIGSVLAKNNFAYATRLLGYAEYKLPESEPYYFLVLHEFLRNQGDAFELFSEEFGRFVDNAIANEEFWAKFAEPRSVIDTSSIPQQLIDLIGVPFVENVKLLAKRTAQFHKALLSESGDQDFAPEQFGHQYVVSITQSMMSYAARVFNQMASAENLNSEVKEGVNVLLGLRQKLMSKFVELRSVQIDSVRARIHGDYHLGQVLYTGNDFTIIDYEGEPMRSIGDRRTKRSQLRDVAGMVRSFYYVAHSYMLKSVVLQKDREKGKLEQLVSVWASSVSRLFLIAYLESTDGSKIVPSDPRSFKVLFEAYLMEKAIYEIGYEINNRPDWAMIPISGLLGLLGMKLGPTQPLPSVSTNEAA
ncbi:MAG: maltose alpha-D-glucosyltransferase [Nitrososphaerota archaeon]|nr:maltose alpha-D-glucosyltransferase [Nitrososphaerota archaeon]